MSSISKKYLRNHFRTFHFCTYNNVTIIISKYFYGSLWPSVSETFFYESSLQIKKY